LFPTLARIALDVLPSQALSVPCERLFSGTKQIADDCRLRLGSKQFEELAIMGSAWGPKLYDFTAWNAAEVEEVMLDYDSEEMLLDDVDAFEWEKELDSDSFELEL
jgi:hAT family C-terminal dimerisation region